MKTIEEVKAAVNSLSDADLFDIHKEVCQLTENFDDEVFDNDEDFFENNFLNPMEAVRAAMYGEYNYVEDYVKINAYGNLETAQFIEALIDVEEVIETVFENQEQFEEFL